MIKNNQHYIPRFYLNLFTDPDTPCIQTPYVWIFDRESGNVKNKAPMNFAYIKGYNNIVDKNGKISTAVEEEFRLIEDKAAKVMRKILELKYINRRERQEMCKFVCSMKTRVPLFRNFYRESIEKQEYKVQLRDYVEKHKFNINIDEAPLKLEMDSVIRVVNQSSHLLMGMFWSLLISDESSYFITSDNPVIIKDSKNPSFHLGFLSSETVEVFFPLSRKMCLRGTWINKGRLIEYIDKDEVASINFEVFKHSYNYIYSSTKTIDKRIYMSNYAIKNGLLK